MGEAEDLPSESGSTGSSEEYDYITSSPSNTRLSRRTFLKVAGGIIIAASAASVVGYSTGLLRFGPAEPISNGEAP